MQKASDTEDHEALLHKLSLWNKRYSQQFVTINGFRGGSRTAATSMMERFVIIVNGFQPLTIITKRSILDVAAIRDPPLDFNPETERLRNLAPKGSSWSLFSEHTIILGPLLSLIYINNLRKAIIFSQLLHFADDTCLLNIQNKFFLNQ